MVLFAKGETFRYNFKMNYLLHHLLRDPKFWFKVVVIPGVIVLAIFDFLSAMLSPPGLSNLRIFYAILVLLFAGVLGYGIYLCVVPKRDTKIRMEQARFEKQRLVELTTHIEENPDFQTFCYLCKHYNLNLRSCGLDIKNEKARAVRLGEPHAYCLYWEKLGQTSPQIDDTTG